MFSTEVLAIDAPKVAHDIEEAIRRQVQAFRRRGAVLGVSGGIDSAVTATLCTRANPACVRVVDVFAGQFLVTTAAAALMRDLDWVQVATWNDPQRSIDANALLPLVQRALELAGG